VSNQTDFFVIPLKKEIKKKTTRHEPRVTNISRNVARLHTLFSKAKQWGAKLAKGKFKKVEKSRDIDIIKIRSDN